MSELTKTFRLFFPSSFRASGLIAALMFLICLAAVESANAATYTVTTTANTGAGSLRAAISSANATAEADTIEFAIAAGDAGCMAGVCTITLTSGNLAITSATTAGTLLITNSTGASNLLISGNNTSRVFSVNSGANLTINGVTITKGNGAGGIGNGSGGGIFNDAGGTLTLTNSTVSGNTASASGGGIAAFGGTMTLTNSTVSGNTATDSAGGGIYAYGATSTLTNSTVSGNTAINGGGINNTNSATLTLINSTISGNMASNNGGGIFNVGGATSTLTNSTVSGNTAFREGGGIGNTDALNLTSVTVTQNKSTCATCTGSGGIRSLTTANLKNTIVAGNTKASESSTSAHDFYGAIAAGSSYNLIGNGQGTNGITNGANGNQIGTALMPIDPQLEDLAFNGGPTQTHALKANSPAIDKGNSFGLTTDQRGFFRPVDLFDTAYPNASDGADIGAFEAQFAATPATVSIGGRVTTTSGQGIGGVSLTLFDNQGNEIATTISSASGDYHFDNVELGATYTLKATGKSYIFNQPSQVIHAYRNFDDVNFIGERVKRRSNLFQ